MKKSYLEMSKCFCGYHIRKTDGFRDRYLYVKSIRNGIVKWTRDYTYAQAYSEKTARKHIADISVGKVVSA